MTATWKDLKEYKGYEVVVKFEDSKGNPKKPTIGIKHTFKDKEWQDVTLGRYREVSGTEDDIYIFKLLDSGIDSMLEQANEKALAY